GGTGRGPPGLPPAGARMAGRCHPGAVDRGRDRLRGRARLADPPRAAAGRLRRIAAARLNPPRVPRSCFSARPGRVIARPAPDDSALLRGLRFAAPMQPPVIIWIIFTVQPDFVANNLYAAHGV